MADKSGAALLDRSGDSTDGSEKSNAAGETSLDYSQGPGTLTIKNRVGEQIVRRATLDVDGVVSHSGALGLIGAGEYPRVSIDMSVPAPVVAVQIAVRWPSAITTVARQVRRSVFVELYRLTGVSAARVDVAVAAVIGHAESTDHRRVQ